MREVEPELVPIVFNGLARRQLHIRVAGKAPWVEHPGVVARLAMHDLLRQKPAVATPFAQPRAQTDDAEGVPFAGDRTNQRCAVHRVGDGAIHDRLDADVHQGGHAGKSAFQNVRDPI